MTNGKTRALTIRTFVSKVMSLLLNSLSRLVIAFLPRNKLFSFHGCSHCLQWFWSPRKWSLSLFPLFPHLFAMKWWDWMPWSYIFECWVVSQLFHSPLSLSSRGSLVPLCFLWKGGVICIYFSLLIFHPAIMIPACASSMCFYQPSVSHDILCIEVK